MMLLGYLGKPSATVTYSITNADLTEHTAETGTGVTALKIGTLNTLYGVVVADPPIGGVIHWYEGGAYSVSETITQPDVQAAAQAAIVAQPATLTAAYDKAKDDVLAPLAVVDGVLDGLAAAAYSSGVEIAEASLNNIYYQARSAIEDYDPPKKSELDAAVAPLSTAANLAALDAKVDTVDAKVDTVDGILDTTLPPVLAGIADAVDGIAADYAKTGEAEAAVATLNDFDPATDVVAHVTLVDTTTTNTDMRGTDNAMLAASYTAPDNVGIAAARAQAQSANGKLTYERLALIDGAAQEASIAALPTDADVQTAAAAAITAYDPPTKAELDASVGPLATAASISTLSTRVTNIMHTVGQTDIDVQVIDSKLDALSAGINNDLDAFIAEAGSKIDTLILGHAPTDTYISHESDLGIGALGPTTPFADIVAVSSSSPLRYSRAAFDGTWGIWLPSGTWELRFSRAGYYDPNDGDSMITVEVVIP